MKNYEYIIASLPNLEQDNKPSAHVNAEAAIAMVMEHLDNRDRDTAGFLLHSFEADAVLDSEFYCKALEHKNRFIREYFSYDLDLRNVKVEYLNRSLGRPLDQDKVETGSRDEEYEFEGRDEVLSILEGKDILKRERGLDDLMWSLIDGLTEMEVLNLELILGLIAKLKIIDRWEKLDDETGRELFRKLVGEIRATYDNKKNNII